MSKKRTKLRKPAPDNKSAGYAEELSKKIDGLSKARILCVGDLILDNFIYGDVTRISPEAPVPIIRIDYKSHMLGGAGNVVRNITSLGGKSSFITVIGNDQIGTHLTSLVAREENIEPYLQTEKGRISSEKTRYIARNQHMLRTDYETTDPINKNTEKTIIRIARAAIKNANVVVLSDYAKGVLTDTLLREVIAESAKQGKIIIVDPKRSNYSVYKNASIVTPNLSELAVASGMSVEGEEQIVEAAENLIKKYNFKAVLVTRGKGGMTLVNSSGDVRHFLAAAQEVFDVSGAGDTVVACLAAALSSGFELEDAVYLANVAAGIVVGRIGTAQVFRTDLKTALVTHDLVTGTHKIMPADAARNQIEQWRESGLKIGFTNGCFDLIHPGHISLMDQAGVACDKLIVGLNSDASVTRLKGKGRPIQNEMSRALVLSSLEAVDMVILFNEDTPEKLLKTVRPDVLVKGEDYKISEVVGADFVKSYGGKVVLAKLSQGQSTSSIVKRISA